MAEELDDWLEDLGAEEESTADDAGSDEELDQSDIDSLLSGDDSVAAASEDAESDGELDQSDIDSLLSGDENVAAASEDAESEGELDQSDIDSLLSGDDSVAGASDDAGSDDELGQSDIDSLLSGDDSSEALDDAGSDGEIDQSDIDSLLAGDDLPDEAETKVADGGLIDQSNIDDLLAGDSENKKGEQAAELSPDQEEIDRLFSEIDDDSSEPDPFQAEEIEFDDLLSNETDDTFLTTGNEFASDEFDLGDDVPDIPDDESTVIEARGDAETIQEDESVATESQPGEEPKGAAFFPVSIPAIMLERRNQAIAGGVFLSLLLGLFFMFSGGGDGPETIAQLPETPQVGEPVQSIPPLKVANSQPQVEDLSFTLDEGVPIAVVLTAHDAEGDELQYELLTQPEYGKLTGTPPNLVYSPAPGFPGKDLFDFRVNDGTVYSISAIVNISGQEIGLVQAAPKFEAMAEPEKIEPKVIEPRKLIVLANNFSYSLTGTEPFFIDWQTLWNDANFLPYSEQIVVEIISQGRNGKLQKKSGSVSQYMAKKYFGGRETIRYRFVLGRQKSKIRNISLNILPGNPAPEIKMGAFGQLYRPGEMVLLDASNSLDDQRQSLTFTWQQLAGPAVRLNLLNEEGSRVSFVAPSSFNTVMNPGPLMRLTVRDATGKQDVVEVKISTKSRYKSAIWGDIAYQGN